VTVKELIAKLQGYPENYVVVLARDGEGNNFSPLWDEVDTGSWDYEYWEWTPFEGEHEEDFEINAVSFWPVK
jgi:hypothetical protein